LRNVRLASESTLADPTAIHPAYRFSFLLQLRHAAANDVLREPDPQSDTNTRMVRISPAYQVHIDTAVLGLPLCLYRISI